MTRPLRIGVIGAGTITQSVHLGTIRRSPFELAGICDLSPSRAAEVAARNGVPGTTEPASLLARSDVDAVIIATPGSHARIAVQALQAGKHVLAEKPLAVSFAEVDEVEAAAKSADRIIQVGYMKMYDPLISRARTELAELHDVRLV